MLLKFINEEGGIDEISHDFLRRTDDPGYIGLKAGDFHIITPRDIDHNIVYSLRSFNAFINFELDKSHEYYNILKQLIESKDINNLRIAFEIINKI